MADADFDAPAPAPAGSLVDRSIAVQYQPGGAATAFAALTGTVASCGPSATWTDSAGDTIGDLSVVADHAPLTQQEVVSESVTTPAGVTSWVTTAYEFDGDYLSVVSTYAADQTDSEKYMYAMEVIAAELLKQSLQAGPAS